MFDVVDAALKSGQNLQVATTARAVKFAASKLKNVLTLKLLADDLIILSSATDVEVKKNALEALTSIIHSNWNLVKSELRFSVNAILAFALTETRIRPELIEEVDLGPFKHKVDNGLSMRKAAF